MTANVKGGVLDVADLERVCGSGSVQRRLFSSTLCKIIIYIYINIVDYCPFPEVLLEVTSLSYELSSDRNLLVSDDLPLYKQTCTFHKHKC